MHGPFPPGLGNPNIDGYFLDDGWSASGPSEEDNNCTAAMGLTAQDVSDLTAAWKKNLATVHETINTMGGFSWDQFTNKAAVRMAGNKTAKACADWFHQECA